jgi:iron complex transport system permease protein
MTTPNGTEKLRQRPLENRNHLFSDSGHFSNDFVSEKIYTALVRRRNFFLVAMIISVLLSAAADLSVGPSGYHAASVLTALWVQNAPLAMQVIALDIRLPAVLAALVVGAGLSVSGTLMQTVLNNPLASPFTLGISAAASFGAALGLVFGPTFLPAGAVPWVVPLTAFTTSIIAVFLVERVAKWREMTNELIILLGTALVFTFSALLKALQYAVPDRAIEAVVFWSMGSLSRVSFTELGIIAGILLSITAYFMRHVWMLTAMRLGETRAGALGIPVSRLRLQTVFCSSVLASVCVSFVGTIGFVGLVAPHIARMLIGEDQRFLLPASALCGATLLSMASVAGKTLLPGQILPTSIVTSLVGVPLFLILILRRGR